MKYILGTKYNRKSYRPVLDGDDSVRVFDSAEQVKAIFGLSPDEINERDDVVCKELTEAIIEILPNGSGFDCNWVFDKELKNGKLVFTGGFHNMNEWGSYDGWTTIRLIVDPRNGFQFDITKSGNEKYRWAMNDFVEETIAHQFELAGFDGKYVTFYRKWGQYRDAFFSQLHS